jgi:hypothetical protein
MISNSYATLVNAKPISHQPMRELYDMYIYAEIIEFGHFKIRHEKIHGVGYTLETRTKMLITKE